ncbi:MAG: branched-chain amino acid ABC transporter permease [Burkholderiales bacterium]|nr:branched-chain amino acid ABC transporter permease [Burkholderiales bacterium]ODU69251.1 MAG: ABC transporter permease [Lautropia sp. SCN 66-9]
MTTLYLTQLLNGLQFGVLLFLLAAGLTLIFGIMNFVNLAHGSLYMLGAYFAATVANLTGSFVIGLLVAVPGAMLVGIVLEKLALGRLYSRDHLDHVLATFGLVLFINEVVRMIWGASPVYSQAPEALSGTVDLFGISYSSYRFAIIVAGLAVAAFLYWMITHTRIGMLIRAGATHAAIVSALGVNIKLLNTLIFGLGAALAGLAGVMAGPILSVQPGMGETILIQTLVVIIVGGIGSIRGAFLAALLIGVVETIGRAFLPIWMSALMPSSIAQAAGPAVASMLIYLLMAIVLAFKPEGLFPVRHG